MRPDFKKNLGEKLHFLQFILFFILFTQKVKEFNIYIPYNHLMP